MEVGSGSGAAVAVAVGVDAAVGDGAGVEAITVAAGVAGFGVEVGGAATVTLVGVGVADSAEFVEVGFGGGVGMPVGATAGGAVLAAVCRAGAAVGSDSQAISPITKVITASTTMKLSTRKSSPIFTISSPSSLLKPKELTRDYLMYSLDR